MIKAEWREAIKRACSEAGTYQPFFDTIIDELAQILEIRDTAMAQYVASGNSPVVTHTNKGGHSNIVKNPALAVINEQNQQALAYWRDLGLTPAGYKKLNGDIEQRDTTFEDALAKIGV